MAYVEDSSTWRQHKVVTYAFAVFFGLVVLQEYRVLMT